MKNVTIYMLRAVGTQWAYVGATTNPEVRFRAHKMHLRLGKHVNRLLQSKYDLLHTGQALEMTVLETCRVEQGVVAEAKWIVATASSYELLNMRPATRPNTLGRKTSQEIRNKISAGCKGKKGRHLSREESARIRNMRKPMSAENKAKLAARMRAQTKPVYNVTTGETFSSAIEAGKAYGCHSASINNAISGKMKQAKGCQWSRDPNKKLVNLDPSWSPERRERQAAHLRDRVRKPVVNVDTGEIHSSITAAARSIGCNLSTLAKVLRQSQCGGCVKGIHWAYYTDTVPATMQLCSAPCRRTE